MWKSERGRSAAWVVAALVLGLASTAAGGELRETIEKELRLTRTAREVQRGLETLERERESLEYATGVIGERGKESFRRLDAYRVSRKARERQATRRSRALYKLARGGFLRLALEDLQAKGEDAEAPSERVLRGRSIRWLVEHDLQELSVHRRAEDRAEAELLATMRELSALSAMHVVSEMQAEVSQAAKQRLDPALAAVHRSRRRLQARRPKEKARQGELLRALNTERRELVRARGLDLLEKNSLRRPVAGRIIGPFGDYDDPLLRVPMHRNGVELSATQGRTVRAIADGEVVFAGELPGFDEVVVIDHGGGYLSLTGRLLGLKVEEGEALSAGAELARVAPKAVDDGLGTTVYLELRHAERPVDPAPWLR